MTPRESINILLERMNEAIIGQEHIVDRFVMGLLADGNLLVEGLPGLAKTRAVRSMADAIDATFSRIQFTPDLSPSDVMGSERVYEVDGKKSYRLHKGPIFGNIILADEINRAPAMVQAAMLEAMEEHQVTIAGQTFKLPKLKDRFFMHVKIGYVTMDSEYQMIQMVQNERHEKTVQKEKIPQEMIFAARDEVGKVKISEAVGKYIVELVFATRYPMRYSKQLDVMIDVGVSPRASLALTQCSQVHAWMKGRDEVTVQDVHSVIHDVFRHRIIRSEHTRFSGIQNDEIIDIVVKTVPLPEIVRS